MNTQPTGNGNGTRPPPIQVPARTPVVPGPGPTPATGPVTGGPGSTSTNVGSPDGGAFPLVTPRGLDTPVPPGDRGDGGDGGGDGGDGSGSAAPPTAMTMTMFILTLLGVLIVLINIWRIVVSVPPSHERVLHLAFGIAFGPVYFAAYIINMLL